MYETCKGAMLLVAALACASGCQKPKPGETVVVLIKEEAQVLKTPEDVKALFPDAEWRESQQEEGSFLFCANHLLSFGCSDIDVRGWVFRPEFGRWESVFVVRLNGLGQVTLSVDPGTHLFSAKGGANNQFLGKPAFTFDLRATER